MGHSMVGNDKELDKFTEGNWRQASNAYCDNSISKITEWQWGKIIAVVQPYIASRFTRIQNMDDAALAIDAGQDECANIFKVNSD